MPSLSGGKGAYLKYVTDPRGKKVQNMPYKIEITSSNSRPTDYSGT